MSLMSIISYLVHFVSFQYHVPSTGMADRHVEILGSRNQSVRVPVSVIVIFADLG
jgi:hypothetical protein